MCFEFEWLYWAQIAQEEERRRAAEAASRRETATGSTEPGAERRPDRAEPAHA
jgi:hypothetical protein